MPSKPISAKKRPMSRGFKAGVIAGGFAVVGSLTYTAGFIWNKYSPGFMNRAIDIAMDHLPGRKNLFPEPIYVTQYYSDSADGHKYQRWKLTLRGETEFGEIEDVETGNKGVIHGYRRADALSLDYAFTSPDRPGFGMFVLRPSPPANAKDSTSYAGMASVHECECDADPVKKDGVMLTVPAVLTDRRKVPAALEAMFFNKSPVRADITWPSDIQRTASATL